MKKIYLLLAGLCLLLTVAQAQNGGVRGKITDKLTGGEVAFASVYLQGTGFGISSDIEGYFTLANVPAGDYVLCAQYLGYDSTCVAIKIQSGRMATQNLAMSEKAEEILVEVSADRTIEKNETRVSVISITAKDINRLPSIGGKADIAQYLQVTPGVTFTGDQGGQFYIRGGAPIQNKILLDGMPIYNAFHSIGFYSVFETDIIRSADVYTGGFGAAYGGRSSAVIDIRTREAHKKRVTGNLTITPFVTSALLEIPIIKPKDENSPTLGLILTGKHSYLRQVSPKLYSYANEQGVLPFNFTDVYGKLSFAAPNGSRVNAFGFYFDDKANFNQVANYGWKSGGAGMNFRLLPTGANIMIDGALTYSGYNANFIEGDSLKERSSRINSFSGNFNFTYFMAEGRQLVYGVEINSFYTDFNFVNNQGIGFGQAQTNSEVAGFISYRGRFGNLVLEPSFRGHFYASLGEFRAEPRLAVKYNITDWMRVKAAGGLYSQNLISSVDERDVVNLFVGFLGGPESGVYRIENGQYVKTKSRLQTSIHAILGFEFNLGKRATLNVEPYIKYFPQIISLNRNRLTAADPDYIAETGKAYGIDVLGKYEYKQFYAYLGYSLGYVNRNDGVQTYYASFDRRHNVNAMVSYEFALSKPKEITGTEEEIKAAILARKEKTDHPFELSLRWNVASGFPFTQTQGFYQWQTFNNGIGSNYLTDNNNPQTQLGVIYENQLNRGRLPFYHRLDFSARYTLDLKKHFKLLFGFSLTNSYNRQNIFYFDRVRYNRVNQLPILPALSVTIKF